LQLRTAGVMHAPERRVRRHYCGARENQQIIPGGGQGRDPPESSVAL
jgi:hypothetical protein